MPSFSEPADVHRIDDSIEDEREGIEFEVVETPGLGERAVVEGFGSSFHGGNEFPLFYVIIRDLPFGEGAFRFYA